MESLNRWLEGSHLGPLGQASPEAIVASAQRFIASSLATPITARSIAQSIGVTVSDLRDSFRFVLREDLNSAILGMRLKALHVRIETAPERSLQELAAEVGLLLDQEISDRFSQEFWMTPERWQQLCWGRLRFPRTKG